MTSESRLYTLEPKGTESDYNGSFDVIGNGQMILGLQMASKAFEIIQDMEHALDSWFETEVIPQLTGYAQLLRYADDFVVCFEKEEEARAFEVALRQRMGKFGRCACQRVGKYSRKCETFDFLGFTHFCDKTRKGKFKLGRKMSRQNATKLLRSNRETRPQMDKQAQPEDTKDLSRNIHPRMIVYNCR